MVSHGRARYATGRRIAVSAALVAGLALASWTATPAHSTSAQATSAQAASAQAAPSQSAASEPGPQSERRLRVETRIEDLHARLHITAEQESAWAGFAEVMRDDARHMDEVSHRQAQQLPQMSAVDHLRSYAEVVTAHAQDVQRLVPAFQAVYDAMSPEQKRAADQLFRNFAERSQQRAVGRPG